jgi:hypothetical protein
MEPFQEILVSDMVESGFECVWLTKIVDGELTDGFEVSYADILQRGSLLSSTVS